jgi:palmitoyltransferase
MTGSSLQFAFLNTTTIENLTRRSKVWQLAFYMARPPIGQSRIGFPSVTYPLIDDASIPQALNSKRTFAILHSKPGEQIWDLGPFANFQSVMGVHWYEWFIPLRYSPCCDHSRGESQFQMGHVVERMREEAGLVPPRDSEPQPSSRWGDYRSRRSKLRNSIKSDAPQTRDEGKQDAKGRNGMTDDEERNGGIELSHTDGRQNGS